MSPGGRRVIRSKAYKGKGKDEVVASMDRKLASGAAVTFRKDVDARSRKASVAIFYVTLYGVLIALAAASFAIVKMRSPRAERRGAGLVQPSKSLRAAFETREISVNEYAIYLSYVLVRYNMLPEKFRKGIPRISPEEVYLELDRIWLDLADDTRSKIAQDLPDYARKYQPGGDQQIDTLGTPPPNPF